MVCMFMRSISGFGPDTHPNRIPEDKILLILSQRSTRPSTSIEKYDGMRFSPNYDAYIEQKVYFELLLPVGS